MKITQPAQPVPYALNAPASGTSFDNSGGSLPPGTNTVQDAIAAILAGGIGSYLTTVLGGQGAVQALGTLGATETIDLANANYFWGTLDQDCTVSFTGWTTGKDSQITVEVAEDGTGGWTPTFSGVTWIGGTTPTHDTTPSTVTIYVFLSRDGGTTIYGAMLGDNGVTPPGSGPLVVAKVYNNATQTVTDNPSPPTVLTMNSTDFDTSTYKSGNKFIIPAGHGGVAFELSGGTFSQTFNAGPISAPTADLFLAWFINGAMVRGGNTTYTQPVSSSNPGQPVGYIRAPVTLLELADADEVELRVYIDNNGSSMVFGHATSIEAQTWMAIKRLAN